MEIVNAPYSFVQFDSPVVEDACCDGVQEFCIPVIEETDTYFQIKVTTTDYAEVLALLAAPIADMQLLLLSGSANTPATISANILRNWTAADGLLFERYRTGIYEVTYLWRSAFKDIKTLLNCGDCFQLAIIKSDSTLTSGEFSDEFSDEFSIDVLETLDIVAISNCFKRHCTDCYMSILEYYNDDDYADFNYCNITNPVNRVRLPFYLTQPKQVEDKSVYRKSNGKIKQTRSLLTKEYLVPTDHLPGWVHDRISVALAHDEVGVESGTYSGGISKNGEYAIEWTDNICVAPALFKALATPYAIRNNNCQECEVIVACEPVVIPDFTLADANQYEAYSQTITLGGSAPFVLSNVVKPAWMTVSVDGSIVSFTGTPVIGQEGTGIAVSFDVANDCGSGSADTTINVIEAPCIGVAIVGTPVLPDAYSGLAYTYTISLTGTAPFTLSGISKPDWMSIDVVGSTIEITGTPAIAAPDVVVIFTINNCDSDLIEFLDTIDVLEIPDSYLDTTSYTGDGGAITDHCTSNAFITRTPGATEDATIAGATVRVYFHVEPDNPLGCPIDDWVVFGPTNTIQYKYIDCSCLGAEDCAAVTVTITSVILL